MYAKPCGHCVFNCLLICIVFICCKKTVDFFIVTQRGHCWGSGIFFGIIFRFPFENGSQFPFNSPANMDHSQTIYLATLESLHIHSLRMVLMSVAQKKASSRLVRPALGCLHNVPEWREFAPIRSI